MLEEIVMHVLTFWQKATDNVNLCFVGGVAQNSSLNGLILRSGIFREVFIHPASHDAGAAEGAALETARMLGDVHSVQPRLRTASFGPPLRNASEIEHKLGKTRRMKAGGGFESVYEIYLDYTTGDRTEISPGLFHLVDSVRDDRPLRCYTGPEGLTPQLRDELFQLWQRRFITLLPE